MIRNRISRNVPPGFTSNIAADCHRCDAEMPRDPSLAPALLVVKAERLFYLFIACLDPTSLILSHMPSSRSWICPWDTEHGHDQQHQEHNDAPTEDAKLNLAHQSVSSICPAQRTLRVPGRC